MTTGLAKRLVQDGLLSEQQAASLQHEAKTAAKPFVTYLAERGILSGVALLHSASEEFGIPVLDLSAFELDAELVQSVDERLIVQFKALPLLKRGKKLFVAIADPANLQGLDQIQFHTGLTTSPVLVDADQLEAFVNNALDTPEKILSTIEDKELEKLEFGQGEESGEADTITDTDDAPLVRYVNKVLLDAIRQSASDIHFEPYEKTYRVRFRIDGILHEASTPPSNIAPRITARLKVMARLDIAERRMPQDGRIKLKLSKNKAIDFRVSTCPTLYGEKVVLRILDSAGLQLGMDVLGMEDDQKQYFLEAIHKPHGMVLVTGPTGSGKTVTLYNAMHILNDGQTNLSSVEDPAEIYLPGVNQVNVNNKIGLDFAATLRAFLRQDPDVIMVGEIRDLETAEIAVKAANTGHLVLSTLHTNSAPQTLTRLLNMGIEPYHLASSLNLIVAQRLMRKLCKHCKQPLEMSKDQLLAEGFPEQEIGNFAVFVPVGCPQCHQGYREREGIFQVMPVSDAMERIILQRGDSLAIKEQAQREHIRSLRQSGLLKVMKGISSLEELNRVSME